MVAWFAKASVFRLVNSVLQSRQTVDRIPLKYVVLIVQAERLLQFHCRMPASLDAGEGFFLGTF